MSMRALVSHVETTFREAGILTARAEAEWLLAGLLGVSRTELYLCDDVPDSLALEGLPGLVARRVDGVPLQYLLGRAQFCGLELTVSPAVFLPRPETEGLTDEMARYLHARHEHRSSRPLVLDLGTGSGCIAIRLATAVPSCVVVAVELSWEALQVARANVGRHRVDDRVNLICAQWTSALGGPFDAIISNPPYVPTREVRPRREGQDEPLTSLDGGADGMAFHRRLISDAKRLLASGGVLCMECAEDQAEPLAKLASAQPWAARALILHDLSGRPRGVWIDRRGDPRV